MKDVTLLPAWLRLMKCHHVRPVTVTIADESFDGCEYIQTHTYTKEMDCVQRGDKKAGDTYDRRNIYCVGRLPIVYHPKRKKHPLERVAFDVDGVDWYVSCYMPLDRLTEPFKEHHPFGVNFILSPWDLPERIDAREKPYTRHKMTITYKE